MSGLPIISADERLAERRGIKGSCPRTWCRSCWSLW